MACFKGIINSLCPPASAPKTQAPATAGPPAKQGLGTSVIPGVPNHVPLLAGGHGKPPDPRNREGYRSRTAEIVPAEVRLLSGCQDPPIPFDGASQSVLPATNGAGGNGGACANGMLSALERNPHTSWKDLLADMSVITKTMKYTQAPQLSTTKEFSLSLAFSLKKNPQSRTKALFIGINYVGQQGELRGCHNDVEKMRRYVQSQGFQSDRMKVLMDDGQNTRPTKAEMLNAFKWLIDGVQEGDSLFFHFSGHGGRLTSDLSEERDSFDQSILPLDHETAGHISDESILQEMILPLPNGVMLTMVVDCCHFGGIVELPYAFVANQENMNAVTNGSPIALRPNPEFKYRKFVRAAGRILQSKTGADGRTVNNRV